MAFLKRASVFLIFWFLQKVYSGPTNLFENRPDHPPLFSNNVGQSPNTPIEELEASYWLKSGLKTLDKNLKQQQIKTTAKNVILFLGDGMSFPTIAAARIYKGQQNNKPGEETRFVFEDFPSVGVSKTYCTDRQVSDSACSATAYFGGVKGSFYTIGLTGKVRKSDCKGSLNESTHTSSIVEWAQTAGKATGAVTTTRITHASPAGAYAHTASREWENDAKMPKDAHECKDIAHQLVFNEPGKSMKVLMGGGRGNFLPAAPDGSGSRNDQQNLINKWKEDKTSRGQKSVYVSDRKGLMDLDVKETDYLLGLFANSHFDYYVDANHTIQPSLVEMTEKAIQLLAKEKNGYFLFVEGGHIDLAHHDNYAHKSMVETTEFEKAIRKAAEMTDIEDTLIVVTADHSHSFALNGYPLRGNPIFGVTGELSEVDNLPYSTLSYSNGPMSTQYEANHSRHDLRLDNMNDPQYRFPGMVRMNYETHAGDDIGVYARGPWAHLLDGQFDQNYIPIVMSYAAKIGPAAETHTSSAVSKMLFSSHITFLFSYLTVIFTYFYCK